MNASLAERVRRRAYDAGTDRAGGLPDAGRVRDAVAAEAPLLGPAASRRLADEVMATAVGCGALEPFLADPAISEVMLHPNGEVWVERDGRVARTAVAIGPAEAERILERLVLPLGLRADRLSSMVDGRLPDGARFNAVLPPLSIDGLCLTIRKFSPHTVDLDQVCPAGVAPLLRWAVRARCNLLVVGGTGSGKTTLLNALAAELPREERIVTVEDAAELRLPGDHVIRLEARRANAEGAGAVTIRDLVRNALRMRPDRIIVGEARGAEAIDMLQAMNTGHEGSMSTCHANGPAEALTRLETMVMFAGLDLPLAAVQRQVTSAIDLIVQVARGRGAQRRVVAIAEPGADGSVTHLADGFGLHTLPVRPPRFASAGGPDRGWLAR